ncbi:Alpha-acetolactate decarboxylase [Legionella spiritensis]|uniref:Alpha-acetolactate decarboxylase n=2 Tax=Legionella spiritensis TaxID=452 RepID=A0A0W0Z6U9_LEGSP|nr:Alpha-acetolactate decarboxylase [Legionella spiritensis]SNV40841.1 Alpha-acetolactate decarboxylase precursor [Legionella spiritensis]VEG90492.1 Alpha-acetolactate decarboxylase precursor [Legionella spiritensis]
MYQYSTYDSVYHGQYEGGITLEELKPYGGFGLGTFDALEGELVAFGDHFYHCVDGRCTPATMASKLAWAAVCHFNEDDRIILEKRAYDDFKNNVLRLCDFAQRLVAIELQGMFEHITLTSTKKQKKPYPSIETIIEEAIHFPHSSVDGVAVGWFAPACFGGIKSPGFHFHFVDRTKNVGGHVVDFSGFSGQMRLCYPKGFRVDFYNKACQDTPDNIKKA